MNTTGHCRIKPEWLGRGHTVLFNDITEDGRAWISDPHVPSFLLITLFRKTTLRIEIYYIRKYVTEYNFQKPFFFAYKVYVCHVSLRIRINYFLRSINRLVFVTSMFCVRW
jgi:hypothetical protein